MNLVQIVRWRSDASGSPVHPALVGTTRDWRSVVRKHPSKIATRAAQRDKSGRYGRIVIEP